MAALGKFVVEIGSKFDKKGLDRARLAINNVAKAGALMGAALVAAGLKAAQMAGIQEKAEVALGQAMKTAGTFTKEAFEHNLRYASSLQKITIFGDETILSVQKLLSNYGAQGKELDDLTKATLDFATATGMNLEGAAALVGKTIGSTTNALTRYGITVEGAVGSTERMQAAVEGISKLFGGAAQAEAKTYLGTIQQLNNEFGDLIEEVGFKVIPTMLKMMNVIKTQVFPAISSLIENTEKLKNIFPDTTAKFAALSLALSLFAVNIVPAVIIQLKLLVVALAAHPIIAVTAAIALATTAMLDFLDTQADARLDAVETGNSLKSLIAIHRERIEVLKEEASTGKLTAEEQAMNTQIQFMLYSDIKRLENEIDQERLIEKQEIAEKEKGMSEDEINRFLAGNKIIEKSEKNLVKKLMAQLDILEKDRKAKALARIQNFMSTMGFISSLAQSSSRQLRAVGKAAAITTATQDTFAAANKALASAPPPFNFALAAAVIAAGLANVSKIAALADGVRNFVGGLAVVGERGREIINIPRGSDVIANPQTERILSAGGGGDIILNFPGAVFTPDHIEETLEFIAESVRDAKPGADQMVRAINTRSGEIGSES